MKVVCGCLQHEHDVGLMGYLSISLCFPQCNAPSSRCHTLGNAHRVRQCKQKHFVRCVGSVLFISIFILYCTFHTRVGYGSGSRVGHLLITGLFNTKPPPVPMLKYPWARNEPWLLLSHWVCTS